MSSDSQNTEGLRAKYNVLEQVHDDKFSWHWNCTKKDFFINQWYKLLWEKTQLNVYLQFLVHEPNTLVSRPWQIFS